MARIKYGSLVSQISGSIGTATFQKSLFGNTLRSKPIPRHSSSPSQLVCRAYMMQVHYAWRALYPVQRDAWNKFISYSGATINRDRAILLSGHSLFIKYNYLRLFCHLTIMTDPVFKVISPWPTLTEIAFDDPYLIAYYDSDVYEDTLALVMAISNTRLPSLSFTWQGLRSFRWDRNSLSTAVFYPPYDTVFGAIPAVSDILHYSFQFFSYDSPVIAGPVSGVIAVTDYH
jgi:hypothetical protein